jgi:hypothetical protein
MNIKTLCVAGGVIVLASCGDQVLQVVVDPPIVTPTPSSHKKVVEPASQPFQKVVPKEQNCPAFGSKLINTEEFGDEKICYYLTEMEK